MPGPSEKAVAAFKADAIAACERLLAVRPLAAELAGGGRLKSLRLRLPEGTVIATRRKSGKRAELEAIVLRTLTDAGAPVPAVLAFDGAWLMQQDLGKRRLSDLLRKVDAPTSERLLGQALDSLAVLHAAGLAAGLPERLYRIGAKPGWLEQLIALPGRLGDGLGLPAPELPEAEVLALLAGPSRSFVKWDARPANASVTGNGSLAWFDWEHCGRRNRLDDMAWVLCDERVPERPDIEARLIADKLPLFEEPGFAQGGEAYLYAFGTFHACVRTSIVLGDWLIPTRRENGLALDPGRRADALVLMQRAARWSARNDATAGLTAWFKRSGEQLADEGVQP